MTKTCPFGNERNCDTTCPLFISSDDMNEFVAARLGSIGIINRNEGECSLKMIALSQSRMIFENTSARG